MSSGGGWSRCCPPLKPKAGRANDDHRLILNGILWILRTGAPWQDLPERYGPVGTVSGRFYRWRQAGIWQRILEALQAGADRQGRVDWSLHFVDSTSVRAQQHAVNTIDWVLSLRRDAGTSASSVSLRGHLHEGWSVRREPPRKSSGLER